jgi:signal transduction histidine kinase
MSTDRESQVDQRAQLRLGAAIALTSTLLLLPVQALSTPRAQLPVLFLVYALHVVVSGGVLLASTARREAQYVDRLSIVFVGGLSVNLLFYLYALPYAVPTYPSLMSSAFTCLMIAAAVLFSWSATRMAAAGVLICLGFGVVTVLLGIQGLPMAPFVGTLCWLAIGAALATACARVLGRFRTTLLWRHEELAALSTRLISVQEEQLHQLSRELHDELGQSLTAVSSYLWLLEQKLPHELGELRASAREARHLVAKTLGQMREISQLLRPPGLDLYGLGPSVEAHLEAFRGTHRIATSLTVDALPDRLPEAVETAAYRIIQEALTNVARHAHAKRVAVELRSDDQELRLEVRDDGVGLRPMNGSGRRGIGLVGIRERVRALGGTMTMSSDAGGGARLRVSLPLQVFADAANR